MMLPKELRQLLKLSGGKVILSKGNLKDSYVVMALSEHLMELERIKEWDDSCFEEVESEDEFCEDDYSDDEDFGEGYGQAENDEKGAVGSQGLTNQELLDRINADIAELRQRKTEQELEQEFEDEKSNQQKDYSYEELRM